MGPSLLRDELLRWSDRQLALTGQLDTHPAACRSTCEMAGRICRLELEVCEKPVAEFEDPGLRRTVPSCGADLRGDEATMPVLHRATRRQRMSLSFDLHRKNSARDGRRCVREWSAVVLALALTGQLGCNERAASTDNGMRPTEMGLVYSECDTPADCAPLAYCVHPPDEPGFCSEPCDPVGDADSCEESPGGSARSTCVDIGDPNANLCALDCAGDRSCPGGMRCVGVITNEDERQLCF